VSHYKQYQDLIDLGLPVLPSGYYYLFETISRSENFEELGRLTAQIYKKRFLLPDQVCANHQLIVPGLEGNDHLFYKWTFNELVEVGTHAFNDFEKRLNHRDQIGFYLGKKLP